jgi:flagellar biosynthesis protein FliR
MDSGVSGQILYLLGMMVFLTMPPMPGHLLVVSALLDTFQAKPIGEAWVTPSAVDLISDLVHQSLVLGIQVAAPVLVAMSFTALTMGFLSHTVPQINVLNLGFPIRALINLFILSLSLSGAAYLLIELIPAAIDRLQWSLMAS